MRFWTGGWSVQLTGPAALVLEPRPDYLRGVLTFALGSTYLLRWRRLKAQMIEKRSKLGESQTLQQFSRDVDEIEAWISEKLQTASDESYKDPTNIQVS